jgi:predicted enzyme related to lactoylglutathione lyase
MSSRFYSVVVDSQDPRALARFWAEVLDHEIVEEDDDEVEVQPREGPTEPALLFVRVPDGKTVKNRLHIDLAPDDQAAEVERVLALGATRADVGQTAKDSWVVLADPEGNEFCILTAR